jgi:DNA-binding IclR family transcriptional regulator
MHPESKHPPIEFSGTIPELAVTLGLPVSEIRAAIGALIERGHLERVSGSTWRLKPAR